MTPGKTDLVIAGQGQTGLGRPLPPVVIEQVRGFVSAAIPAGTRASYTRAWGRFERWCRGQERPSLPAAPETVAAFFAHCASPKPEGLGLALGSIGVLVAAIKKFHELRGADDPTTGAGVQATMRGIRNTLTARPKRRVAAATQDVLSAGLKAFDRMTNGGKLSGAILLVGHMGAFRRSELRSLDFSDLRTDPWGFSILLRKSKTDQESKGVWKAINRVANEAICPVRALEEWLAVRGQEPGPLFLPVRREVVIRDGSRVNVETIAARVKLLAKAAGRDDRFSGHSMRAGFVTDAVHVGADLPSIQKQTQHKSADQLLGYIREINPNQGNAAALLTGAKEGKS